MLTMSLRATVALATLATVSACEVCHVHYFHKDVATATVMTSNSYCKEYQDQACCTAEVAKGVGDAQTGYIYPDHNPANGCGQLSSACEAFFIEEGCFYECDHNLGKFRKHHDCGDNGWEIEAMPISAAYCDAWYEACKGGANKLCIGSASTDGNPQYDFFSQPDCHAEQDTLGCKRIDEVYTSGRHICETMWGTSYKYETNTTADSYVMSFDEGITNPNNAKFPNMSYPDVCPGDLGEIDFTQAALEGCSVEEIKASASYTPITSLADQDAREAETTWVPPPPMPPSPEPPVSPPPPSPPPMLVLNDYESSPASGLFSVVNARAIILCAMIAVLWRRYE